VRRWGLLGWCSGPGSCCWPLTGAEHRDRGADLIVAFQRLFDPTLPITDCSYLLAHWFAEHYAMSETFSSTALGVVRDAGGRLGGAVWNALALALHREGEPPAGWLRT
jgi:hypothetical protein